MASRISVIWEQIHNWLEKNAPKTLANLHSGATEVQLRTLENICEVQLPEDLRASLAIHNGAHVVFFEGLEYMSVDEMISDWSINKQVLNENDFNAVFEDDQDKKPSVIRDKWWHPKWIPFAMDGCGNSLVVDMDPGVKGTVGQVFFWDHEGGEFVRKASNFEEYLKSFAKDLEDEKYEINEAAYHLTLKD